MAFDMFKKKKELVDFRPKDSDMPIPAKMRERLIAGRTVSSNASPSSSPSASSGSSGGFFSFFGGGSSDSSSSASSPNQEAKTDFWGNSTSSSTSSSSSSTNDKLESSLNDVIYRLSRLTDRLELAEKKIERVERKLGIGSESNY